MPSTTGAACLIGTGSAKWLCRPAMLLTRWALVAKPENLLVTFQPDFIRRMPMICIAFVIPLCQQDRVLGNGWVPDPLCSSCYFSALWTTRLLFADSSTGSRPPLVATGITMPMSKFRGLCHHTVRSTIIFFIVPLSCHCGVLGSQGVVLAQFASAALRTTIAVGPVGHCG